jgi:superfamily II DNA/RNA helicase
MLKILLATALTTRDALDAADNPLDKGFRDDLARIIARTEAELAELARKSGIRLADPS